MTLLALLGSSGPRPVGRRSTKFIENMCGGATETSEWCQWQFYGLGALSIGGLWLLFQLAKWKLAPKDEQETPQLLALVLASVILVGGGRHPGLERKADAVGSIIGAGRPPGRSAAAHRSEWVRVSRRSPPEPQRFRGDGHGHRLVASSRHRPRPPAWRACSWEVEYAGAGSIWSGSGPCCAEDPPTMATGHLAGVRPGGSADRWVLVADDARQVQAGTSG